MSPARVTLAWALAAVVWVLAVLAMLALWPVPPT